MFVILVCRDYLARLSTSCDTKLLSLPCRLCVLMKSGKKNSFSTRKMMPNLMRITTHKVLPMVM